MTHGNPQGDGAGPQVVAWELTRRCPQSCRHCRADARPVAPAGELTTSECCRVVDSLAAAADKPLLILTGGEPLSRSDVWTIARRATAGGLRVVMAPCGVSVDEVAIRHMSEAGIAAISLSVDGATAEQHDAFRGVPGAFAATLKAMDCARRGGLPFQVNALVSRETAGVLPMIHELALREGAFQLDLFFLVPVGRGAGMKEFALGAAASEAALEWAVTMNARGPLRIKTTCAPQVVRVRQRLDLPTPKARHGSPAGGCMAGRGFAFISSLGMLQPCGFCDVPAGDLRQAGFDVLAAYRDAAVFRQLRDVDGYGGKCGRCEFRRVCGGCRARALAASGDYLAEEPSCLHQPSLAHPDSGRASRVVEGCAPGRAAPRILDLKIPAKQRRGGMFPT